MTSNARYKVLYCVNTDKLYIVQRIARAITAILNVSIIHKLLPAGRYLCQLPSIDRCCLRVLDVRIVRSFNFSVVEVICNVHAYLVTNKKCSHIIVR